MTPAIWIAPDAPDLTERQQRVFEAMIERETTTFRSLNHISIDIGDSSPNAIYSTIAVLARKGLVEEAEAPWGWRVRWLHRPALYVRQGYRDGWLRQVPSGGLAAGCA